MTGIILAGLLLVASACVSVMQPRLEGEKGYHDLMIRARRQHEGRLRGGRILVKIQRASGLILFLSPLNQVVLKLEVADGEATLFNPKKKNFWRGTVSEMMQTLWGLPLDWRTLSALLLEGRVPRGRADLGEWRITQRDKGNWKAAELSGQYGLWRFDVLKRATSDKTLPQRQDPGSWVRRSLQEVAGGEGEE